MIREIPPQPEISPELNAAPTVEQKTETEAAEALRKQIAALDESERFLREQKAR